MNKLVRMISNDGTLYCLALDSTEMVREMQKTHNTSKVCSATLGRLITGAGMMGALLKGDKDTLTLKISGGGPASPVVAVANSKGQVKGYIVNSESTVSQICSGVSPSASIVVTGLMPSRLFSTSEIVSSPAVGSS